MACTFGVTFLVSNSAMKIAFISKGTPLEITQSGEHTDDVT